MLSRAVVPLSYLYARVPMLGEILIGVVIGVIALGMAGGLLFACFKVIEWWQDRRSM